MALDRFRVRFAGSGWGIQHSRNGIFWKRCGDWVYMEKRHAEELTETLNETGKCPPSWFSEATVGDGD